MADVFISYARSSAPRAQAVARGLGDLGYDVWIDDALPSHRAFAEVIEEQIANARAVVVIWSHDAARSEWVRSEANHGRQERKLVQVFAEKTRLPMPFDQLQCADLSGWSGEIDHPAWKKVVSSVADLVGRATGANGPSPAVHHDERRHLTVLSCALADAGKIAAALDPEDWRAVSTAFRRVVTEALTGGGGHLATVGETMVAYFGYPVAQEHAARRAVETGLSLAEAVSGLPAPGGYPLAAKVGIHVGTVVISHNVHGAAEVFGDTPAVAAAAQSAAEAGAVVVTGEVRGLVSERFAMDPLGALAGSESTLFKVIGPTAVQGRRHRPSASTPFVGRAEEVGLLLGRWERVAEGQGQLALVVGEAGIGKSRLIDEFRARIAGEAHQWLECGGSPLYANTALRPVVGLVRQIIGVRDTDPPERRSELLEEGLKIAGLDFATTGPLISEMLGIGPAPAMAPEERRRRLLAALIEWVLAAAKVRPLVIVVEDLHWIDASTMELIQALAEQQAMARLMVICTARPEFQPAWTLRGHHLSISLGRMSQRDTRALVTKLADRKEIDREVIEAVIARTDGVPLFVEELTRLVVEGQGAVEREIPATLVDSLAARLDRLGAAKETAKLAAVIGRDFDYPLLATVSPLATSELDACLARLTGAELLYARGAPPEATYRFKHALIVDAAYDALLKSERRELHGRVASAILERFPAMAADQPELLARHWAGAGESDKAIAAYRQAAQMAAGRAAHVEAAAHLNAALALVRQQPEGPARAAAELPVLLSLAVSLAVAKSYTAPELRQVLAEARAICDSLGNVAGLFAVLIGLCNFHSVAGDMPAAWEAALHCQRIGEETGQPAQRIQATFIVGYCHYSRGELVEARARLQEAAALYAEHDGGSLTFFSPTDPLVECLSTLPIVLYALGDTTLAAERAEELLRHARARERPYELAFALAFRWVYDTLARDIESALRHANEGLALCESFGYANFRAVGQTMKGLSTAARGEMERGLAQAREGLKDLERMGILRAIGLYLGEVGRLQLVSGEAAQALATVDQAITAAERSIRICLPRLHLLQAEILDAVDRAAAAAARQKALAIAREQGARTFEAEALAALKP